MALHPSQSIFSVREERVTYLTFDIFAKVVRQTAFFLRIEEIIRPFLKGSVW